MKLVRFVITRRADFEAQTQQRARFAIDKRTKIMDIKILCAIHLPSIDYPKVAALCWYVNWIIKRGDEMIEAREIAGFTRSIENENEILTKFIKVNFMTVGAPRLCVNGLIVPFLRFRFSICDTNCRQRVGLEVLFNSLILNLTRAALPAHARRESSNFVGNCEPFRVGPGRIQKPSSQRSK